MFSRNLRIPFKLRITKKLLIKHQSTTAADVHDPVLLDVDVKTGISTITLNHKPVNSMTLNFTKSFCEKIDLLEKEKIKGMILTSVRFTNNLFPIINCKTHFLFFQSVKNVFSGGLDFNALINPDEAGINAYWFWFQESWIKLYGTSFPTVALINGHAPAGGCVYALSCDYRIMLPNYTIGVNETAVGIVPPKFVMETVKNVIPSRHAELALTVGTLFTTEEALKIGMIDEIANDQEDAKTRCENFLKKISKVSSKARDLTKQSFRNEILGLLKNPKNRSADAKQFFDYILRPSTQKDIENFAANFRKSKK